MKITDVQVDSFGHWKHLQLPELSSQVTVIYGPNEAGKSTLLHLMRGILYGFSVRHHSRFVPARYPGQIGGQMMVSSPQGRFRLHRHLSSNVALRHDTEGELSVQSSDGGPRGKHALTTLLHGVDDAIFRNVFAVGLSEMQHLGTLSDTQAAQQLYGLAAGADRVSISQVAQQLEDARQARLRRRDPQSLHTLLDRLEATRNAGESDTADTPRWLRLVEEQRQLAARIGELEQGQERFSPLIAQVALRAQLREQWKKARQLHRKLTSLGDTPKIPAESLQKLRQLSEQIRAQRKQWEKIRSRRRNLREQAGKLGSAPALIHHADAIQSLHHRTGRIQALVAEVEQVKTRIEETEFELQAELERLGIKVTGRMDAMPLITNELIESLREPARLCREVRERLEAVEQEEQAAQEALEQVQSRLSASLKNTRFTELGSALKRAEQQVRLLQTRIETQVRLDTANRKLSDLREERFAWTKREMLPWRNVLALGMVFSLGAIFLLVALFGRYFNMPTNERGTVAVLGVLVAALALGVKALYEFASRRRAEFCHQEIGELVKQSTRCREEIGRLDKQLPPSADTLQERLMLAEEELDQFVELQPLETQRQTAQQRLENVQHDKANLNAQLKDARNRWRDALRAGSLPEAITPTQFRQLSQPDSKASELRQRLLEHHERSREKHTELRDVQQKVQALMDRAGLHEKSDRIVDQVTQLHQSLQQARQHRQEHETLHRQWRDGAREQERVARDAKRNTQRRQELIAQYGVSSARELKAIVERRQEYLELARERDGILRHLAEQLGKCCTLADLRQDLSKGGFEVRLATWEQEHDQAAATLAELHERRGELNHQLKMLVGRRDHEGRRLEASETAAQFQRRARQWLTLAGISLSLDSVRKSYESERQPETLAEASTYLTSLTQGKYNRIWTPFGEAALCVDDQQGRAVRVEHLSRGTREQVFLSLRLALAASYSRRGAGLPLILDDVFVNFDARRALAAAETICRFAAAGHQVLVFTCHEHIRDVFQKLGVDLRVLPDAARNAENPQPVLPCTAPRAPEPVAVAAPPVEPAPVADYDPELEHELMYGSLADEPGMNEEPAPLAVEPAKPRRKAARRKRAAESVEPQVELLMDPAPLEVPFVEPVEELDREPIFASDWEDPYLLVNPVEYEAASEAGSVRLW